MGVISNVLSNTVTVAATPGNVDNLPLVATKLPVCYVDYYVFQTNTR